uniref:Apoptosis inducing factor mitochondria associated 4 n=1 Tax=Oncorhynchus kisutch TaxID=8019 RepID=A0A8C7GN43_ONCKI
MSQGQGQAPTGQDQDQVTGMVCLESELQDGQMKEVEVDEQKILLVRTQGLYSAVGSKCSHYGAPLIKGALVGDRVRCPFHGACFNIKTGDIEEYPGLDCLPSYKVLTCFILIMQFNNWGTITVNQWILCLECVDSVTYTNSSLFSKVKVEDGKVYVSVNEKSLKVYKRVKDMSCRVSGVRHTILLIGGGPASLLCAETLRQNRYEGRIVMVTRDTLPPIDKPKLSKAMHLESASLLLRPTDFFQQYDIELWTQKEAVSVNPVEKTVKLNDGSLHYYDQLLISTGCRARPLSCPGSELEGVRILQSYEDAKEIHQSCVGKKAVVVGASFIGMEVASYLADKAASVAMVGNGSYPFERSLGPEIGKMTMQMLEESKVKFYMNDGVVEIRGENGKVKEVVLKSGAVVETDVVIAGIGVIPNSDFLKESQVEVDSRKAVIIDKFMRTNIPNVFGAGDVTSFPLTIRKDQRVNIGHWQLASAHGRVAALNMLQKQIKIDSVPFFWTVLLGKSVRYTGYGEGYTEIIFKGKVEERKFLAFYIKDDQVVAAASLMFDPAVARLAEMMSNGLVITKAQAQSDDLSWLKM